MYTYRFSRERSQTVTQRCSVCLALIQPDGPSWWCPSHQAEAIAQWDALDALVAARMTAETDLPQAITGEVYNRFQLATMDALLDERRHA